MGGWGSGALAGAPTAPHPATLSAPTVRRGQPEAGGFRRWAKPASSRRERPARCRRRLGFPAGGEPRSTGPSGVSQLEKLRQVRAGGKPWPGLAWPRVVPGSAWRLRPGCLFMEVQVRAGSLLGGRGEGEGDRFLDSPAAPAVTLPVPPKGMGTLMRPPAARWAAPGALPGGQCPTPVFKDADTQRGSQATCPGSLGA